MARKKKQQNPQQKYLNNSLNPRPEINKSDNLNFHYFLTSFFMIFATVFFVSTFSQYMQLSEQENFEFTSLVFTYYALHTFRVFLFFATYIALKNFSKLSLFLPTISFMYWAVLTGVGMMDLDRELTVMSISFSMTISLLWIIPIIIYYYKRRDLFF